MAVIRLPRLLVVACGLLAAAPPAVVALDPAPTNVAATGEVEATSDTVKWVVKIPPTRAGHAMAYDSARGRVVLFGGMASGLLADTLEWDGNSWVQRTPATRPSARVDHAMAYDSARGRVVLFGGWGGRADTWEWDGNTWVRRTPLTSPPALDSHAMAYDSARGRVVLFGGYDEDNDIVLADTWEWDGNTWVRRTPATSPPARVYHAMAYDSARGRVVLYGGNSYPWTEQVLADTWEWDGNTWVQRTPATSPPAREGPAMAYDSARGRVVLFGGADRTGLPLADTWEWDGDTWIQRTPSTSPRGREYHAMAYDSARGRAVIFGGYGGGPLFTDTWEWDGNTWVQNPMSPSERGYHAMAYDSARERVVLFSGHGAGADTWEWDGNSWVQRTPATSPTARYGHAMAYDSARGRVVLFGGYGYDGSWHYFADTWEWDGDTWIQRTPPVSPPPRLWHAMAYDSARGRVVLFGGSYYDGTSHRLADTWEWDGNTWVQTTPSTSPPARDGHALAYDGARGRVVLFGGRGTTTYSADTWEWDGNTWVQRAPATSPPARNFFAMAYDSARGRVVLFGGSRGGLLADTWEWDGNTWVQRTPATSPPARENFAMVYDSARGFVVLFGGHNGPRVGDHWEYGPANQPPVADAGPDQVLECTGDGKATAALDGSASTDVDSTPRTNDDIVGFVWSENGTTLASAEAAFVPLPLGEHGVLLTVTDRAGATGTDGTIITVQDTTPPVVTCPSSMRAECQAAGQSQVVLPPATATDLCFGAVPITNDRTAGGADASGWYPLGSTTVTFTARDDAGNIATCQTVVTVVDNTLPWVTVEATPHSLWPPNHAMYRVHSRVVAHDACDPSPQVILASVVSSEPDDAPGGGDGNTTNDIQGAILGTPDFDVLLRAERDGNGPGRTYTIRYQARDASGNIGVGQDVVIVPHDQGGIGQDPITRQKRSAKPGARAGQSIAVEARDEGGR